MIEKMLSELCVDKYYEFIKKNKFEPSKKAFSEYCVDKDGQPLNWESCFSDIDDLRAVVFATYPDAADYVFNEDSFPEGYAELLRDEIKKYNRFIVSTLVFGKHADLNFFNSLQTYARANNALILLMTCADAKGTHKRFKVDFDPVFKSDRCWVVVQDLQLNDKIGICDIQQSAKQRIPISSLEKLTATRKSSLIVAGCKQLLKYVPNLKGQIPRALMTTGAVTVNDFTNEFFMSKRTSKLAEADYQAGAVVVEIQDNEQFHFRQIQATEDGSFSDLRTRYYPNGRTEEINEATLVMGDSHVGANDDVLVDAIQHAFIDGGFVDTVVLHDLCNSASVSYHEQDDVIKLIQRANDGSCRLREEINAIVRYINDFTNLGVDVIVVNSNHDNHLDKYVRNLASVSRRDYINMPLAFEALTKMALGEIDSVLEFLVKERADVKLTHPEKVRWLKLDESYVKYGTELGFHGHLGANGAKGSLKTFENAFENAVVGHSHSGAIKCKVFQVGTTSNLDMEYNKGLSSWTRTCCLVHKDGTKQLINFLIQPDGSYSYHV